MLDGTDSILAVVDLVEEGHPGSDGQGDFVKRNTVDESGGSVGNTLVRGVRPECVVNFVRVVRIVGAVARLDLSQFQGELSSNLLGPPGHEVVLGRASHAKDFIPLGEGEVLVLIAHAAFATFAEVHEVRHELGHLIRVNVNREGEGRDANLNLILNSTTEPFGGQDFLPDGVEFLALTAEEVLEQLDLDAGFVGTLDPSRVLSEDLALAG